MTTIPQLKRRLTWLTVSAAFFTLCAWPYSLIVWALNRYSPPRRSSDGKQRIVWADGLRGLLALSVVFGHTGGMVMSAYPSAKWPLYGVNTGFTAVPVFLFLSGFVLTLPTVRKGIRLGSLWNYVERRANRILPAYWAALALSLVIAICVTHTYSWAQILTQDVNFMGSLELMTDFAHHGESTFNEPLYSMPIEWHFYALLPLILLAFRKFNPHWVAFIGVAGCLFVDRFFELTGQYVHFYLLPVFILGSYCGWYLGSGQPLPSKPLLQRAVWLSLVLFIAACAMNDRKESFDDFRPLLSVVFGAWLLLLFAHLSRSPESRIRRAFESPVALYLGMISYSMYLCHWPIETVTVILIGNHLPLLLAWLVNVVVNIACAVAVGSVLFFVFERPYLLRRQRAIAASSAEGIEPVAVTLAS